MESELMEEIFLNLENSCEGDSSEGVKCTEPSLVQSDSQVWCGKRKI